MADYTDMDELQETEDQDMIITLTDEEGQECRFKPIFMFELAEKEYVVLLPMDGAEEADELEILRVEEENGEDVLYEIEDEDEFKAVEAAWEAIVDRAEEDEATAGPVQ